MEPIKKVLLHKFLLILCVLGSINLDVSAQDLPNIEKIDDAVVVILTYDQYNNYLGFGSGVVIDSSGSIITNYHVIQKAYKIYARFDVNSIKYDYEISNIKRGSYSTDLAQLELNNTDKRVFTFIKISNVFPRKGEDVWTIGTPANIEYMNTVSKGVVSNVNKDKSPITIQTNAEITHGSSGGALINSDGKLIGITTSGDPTNDGRNANINFAIWAGEINSLPLINKANVYDPYANMGRVSFYTNASDVRNPSIYINNEYIGTISSYFTSNQRPLCGQAGTITKYLYPGLYNYKLIYSNGVIFESSLYIKINDCLMVGVKSPVMKNNVIQRRDINKAQKRPTIYDYYWKNMSLVNYRIGIGLDAEYNWQKNTVFNRSFYLPTMCLSLNSYNKLTKLVTQLYYSRYRYSHESYPVSNTYYNLSTNNYVLGISMKAVTSYTNFEDLRVYAGAGFKTYFYNHDSIVTTNANKVNYSIKDRFDYLNVKFGFEYQKGHLVCNLDYNAGLITNLGKGCNMVNFSLHYNLFKIK